MQICFLDNTKFQYDYRDKYSPKLRGGETFLINLSSALAEMGHKITIFNNCYKNEIFNTSLNAVGARKILFGSDYPLIDQKIILKILNSQLLSPGDKSSISSENAEKVFKVKRLQQNCR